MNKGGKILLAALIAAVCVAAGAVFLGQRTVDDPVARISLDGEVLQEIRLSQVQESYTFTVESAAGSNTIGVEPGRIGILQADCPDQVCVNQGMIADNTVPIVCLPHKLIVEIVGGDGLDGAAG